MNKSIAEILGKVNLRDGVKIKMGFPISPISEKNFERNGAVKPRSEAQLDRYVLAN